MKKYAFILGLALLAASPSFADNMPEGQRRWPHMGAGAAGAAEGRSDRSVIGRSLKGRTLCTAVEDTGELQDSSFHNHPTAEYVTVISGKFHIGMGDKLDEKKGVELRAGGSRLGFAGNTGLG